MTAAAYYESVLGVNRDTITKKEAIEHLEKYANLRWQEYKKTREAFNSEQWVAQHNFEEKRKRLDKSE
jgi:hypothetical protein